MQLLNQFAINRRKRSSASFSPLTLFSSGEPGAWFDLSDLSTLYQDSAGTVPVTAAGQPVGLVLDKSQGLVLGPELVVNGDFSQGSTGWVVGTGWTVTGGEAVLNSTSVNQQISQSYTFTAGRTYRVSFDVKSIPTNNGRISFTDNAAVLFSSPVGQAGTFTFVFTAASGSNLIGFRTTNTIISQTSIDNISVRELLGFHATQPVASRRPTLIQDENGKYCLSFDGVDDFLVTPRITPGTDKAQVFAGVRAIGTATGIVVENGDASTTNGTFSLASPNAYLNLTHWSEMRGSTRLFSDTGTFPTIGPPRNDVVSFLYDIGGATPAAEMLPRLNGESKTLNVPAPPDNSAGTGNFLAYPLYIGSRGGTIYPFKGNLYSLITRFGSNLDEDTTAKTEAWLNTKTGAY